MHVQETNHKAYVVPAYFQVLHKDMIAIRVHIYEYMRVSCFVRCQILEKKEEQNRKDGDKMAYVACSGAVT